MAMANVASQRGTCERAQVGVVIALEGRVLTTGYNGAPAGLPHCSHLCSCSYEYPEKEHDPTCWSLQPCLVASHAEANAIAWAARHGVQLKGATLYTTMVPCLSCAQLIINAGIVKVIAAQRYRDTSGHDLLQRAGVDMITL
jgi:dCMP deaminase